MKKILIAGLPEFTQNYEKAFRSLKAQPVTSLHVPDPDDYDALLLPGGDDIDPIFFGQINEGSRRINTQLDRIQLQILKAFIQQKKPVMGICKGMQLINVFFGGDIIQHLSCYKAHEYLEDLDKDQAHVTHARADSLLADLYGTTFHVNSAHHQGCGMPGRRIVYTQFAEDGVVEGLCHHTLPIIGVQWHPERMCFPPANDVLVDGILLLAYFLCI
ncbi:MAG: gamma-glutamyl-gamma-aminobutyrate hydrolase family protein [Lachnospiraceae bacterium]|nr:gamma-glutamyl-gamma-aminobutyrate hydrolase family protein [Lachnospiraceae bacterium]